MDRIKSSLKSLLYSLKLLDYLILGIILLMGIVIIKYLTIEKKWVEVLIYDDKVPISLVNSINKGDTEKEPSGKIIAEVMDIDSYIITTKDTTALSNLYLKMRLLVHINPKSQDLEYKNKAIKVGAPIEIWLNNVLLKAIVQDLDTAAKTQPMETHILTIRFFNQKTNDSNTKELYDMIADPLEKVNVAGTHAELVQELSNKLNKVIEGN